MKTLVIDPLADSFWELVESKKLGKYFTAGNFPDQQIESVIIKTFTKVDEEFLNRFPKLRMIIRAGTGYDNIDLAAAKKRNIIVCNTPQANVLPAVEHTISFIFALLKQHQTGKQNIIDRKWKEEHLFNREISDLKTLIVGVGRIGSRVASLLQQLGAEVYGVDPYLTRSQWQQRGVKDISYREGLAWCNLITYHCPLTSETRNYFSGESLRMLKQPVYIVNTARGGVVDEKAILHGIEQGKILGAGLDVFLQEPNPQLSFAEYNNVYLTPHTGAYTLKARQRLSEEIIRVWLTYVTTGKVINEILE